MDMLLRFRQQLARKHRSLQGAGIVVAVSGGPDSVALLHLLHAIALDDKLRLVVAHVNHGLRGAESDEEEQFVGQLAHRLCCPFVAQTLEWADDARNLQARARAARYTFFAEVARTFGARYVATAHHADDRAETVLMNALRGTGLDGLRAFSAERKWRDVWGADLDADAYSDTGIAPNPVMFPNPTAVSDELIIIRPLLTFSKQSLLQYCKANELPYRVDSSNVDDVYQRNALRQQVMEPVSRLFPGAVAALNRLADIASEDEDFLQTQTTDAYARLVTRDANGYTMNRGAFLALPVALQRRLIKLLLNYLQPHKSCHSVDFQWIERLRSYIADERRPNFTEVTSGARAGIFFRRTYDLLEFARQLKQFHGKSGMIIEERLTRAQLPGDWQTECADGTEVWFDAAKLALPLTVRTRLSGDRLQPFGVEGSRSVKRLMIDAKVPIEERSQIPIVCDADGCLLWVVGVRRSRHALIDEDTREVLRLRLDEQSGR